MPIPTSDRSHRRLPSSRTPRTTRRLAPLLGGIAAAVLLPAQPAPARPAHRTLGTVFVIAVHPSEPNYIWAEAGTNFNVHGDGDRDDNVLRPHRTRTVRLRLSDPTGPPVQFDARVLPVTPAP